MAGPPHREPDHLLADRETADTRTQFDHYARQVAALPGRKRRGKQIAYGARANCRLTDIYARCFDLDQNLTCSRNGAGHVAHLKDVDAPVRIELKCPSHERLNEYDRAGIPSRHHTQPIAASFLLRWLREGKTIDATRGPQWQIPEAPADQRVHCGADLGCRGWGISPSASNAQTRMRSRADTRTPGRHVAVGAENLRSPSSCRSWSHERKFPMTLAVTHGHGGEPADSLKLTDIADPPPPGPSQVLVRIRMFAIHPGNERDAHPSLGGVARDRERRRQTGCSRA
jgi:hypothetical protein